MTEPAEISLCEKCARAQSYCVCEFITPTRSRVQILVLQHPQEPGLDIGTVPILTQTFAGTVVRTGLSWPNLKKALGKEVDTKRWAVLYMGSVHVETLPKENTLFAVDKKGVVLADQRTALAGLQGLVLLDGTWSQAKTLWWRNAWLLKLPRLVLNSGKRSVYDQIRKEPRKGCLSTVESAVEALSALEKNESLRTVIEKPLQMLVQKSKGSGVRRQAKKKDYRRFRGARKIK